MAEIYDFVLSSPVGQVLDSDGTCYVWEMFLVDFLGVW